MELEALLQPIDAECVCGEDLSFSDAFDTLAELRREDDPSLPLGDWKEKGKEPKVADWPGAAALCETLLRTRSKDLRIAAWLAEAWTHQHGLRGLADGLALATGLIEQHWAPLHPLPEGDDHEQRIGSLAWLLGRVVSLMHHLRGPDASAPATRADALAAWHAMQALQAAVDARLGADGPAFVAAREAIKALVDDLPEERADAGAAAAAGPGGPEHGLAAGDGPGATAFATMGGPSTRAQALQQLRLVAEYFRRTEPHSPVAYLADKAARWGAMDLHDWLRAVVKDGASLAHLEELLGVEPPNPVG